MTKTENAFESLIVQWLSHERGEGDLQALAVAVGLVADAFEADAEDATNTAASMCAGCSDTMAMLVFNELARRKIR